MGNDLSENITNIPIEKSLANTIGLPEDAYECKINLIEELVRANSLSKKEEAGAMFHFEIIEGPFKGKLFKQFFTAKLTKRSKLTVLCRAVWGDEFTPEEMAQLQVMSDLNKFLLEKPVKVVLLIRHSFLTDTIWYDVAFFLKSSHYDEKINKQILQVI